MIGSLKDNAVTGYSFRIGFGILDELICPLFNRGELTMIVVKFGVIGFYLGTNHYLVNCISKSVCPGPLLFARPILLETLNGVLDEEGENERDIYWANSHRLMALAKPFIAAGEDEYGKE